MEKKDIPQDRNIFGGFSPTRYYVHNENGDFEHVLSSGWEPVNIVNNDFWESINEKLAGVLERVKKGELSPLAYQHLKPRVFNSLDDETLKRYASFFKITVEQLKGTP
jgi:hypothetical protein